MVMVMVMVKASPQEVSLNLCKIPKNDLSGVRACHVCDLAHFIYSISVSSTTANLLETRANLNFSEVCVCVCFHIIAERVFNISAPKHTLFKLCLTRCFSLQVQLPDSVFIDTTETSFVEKYDTYSFYNTEL